MKVAFVTDLLIEGLPNGWLEKSIAPTQALHPVIQQGLEKGFLKTKLGDAYIAQFAIAEDAGRLMEELQGIDFDQVVVVVREDEESQERARVLSEVFNGETLTVLYGSDWTRLGIISIVGEATLIQSDDDQITRNMEMLLNRFVATGELRIPVTV